VEPDSYQGSLDQPLYKDLANYIQEVERIRKDLLDIIFLGKYYDKLDASVMEVVENATGKSEGGESVNVAAPGEMPGMGGGSGDQLKESTLLHYRVHGDMDTGQRAIVVVNDSPEPISYVWEFTHKDIKKAQLYSPFEEVRSVKQGDVLEIMGDGLQILVESGL